MNKLIVIAGPTTTGKSALAIRLSKKIGGEIISADSMQVYRGMDIGTAKLKESEMQGIRHHLIDCVEPYEEFNVYTFKRLANEVIDGIYERGHIPVIAGGTGFYIQSVVYDIEFTEEDNKEIRKRLENEALVYGKEALYNRLLEIDPEYAGDLHFNNVKRVIRALEFYELSGEKLSAHNAKERARKSPYDFKYFVLNDERKRLYENIDKRVDDMIKEGLVCEVKALFYKGYDKSMTSMQGLGYKEILDYLNGLTSLDEAVYLIKQRTRHFAKRQLTYFKREKDAVWINKNDFNYDDEAILNYILERLSVKESRG